MTIEKYRNEVIDNWIKEIMECRIVFVSEIKKGFAYMIL